MKFMKMHGNGNDFIVIEDLAEVYDEQSISKTLCDRHFSIGADGVLFVKKSNVADIKMVIINADGSYAAMCGNGIRCFAKYVWEQQLVKSQTIKIETGDGIKEAVLTIENGKVKWITIYMGIPSFTPESIPAKSEMEIVNKKITIQNKEYLITSLLMGVPHTMVFGDLEQFNIEEGRQLEKNELFPQGTNVNFTEILNRTQIKVKTWERGAGATLACGTGSCAAVVASHKLGFTDNKVEVQVPGGILNIELNEKGVFMSGPAEISFIGECEI